MADEQPRWPHQADIPPLDDDVWAKPDWGVPPPAAQPEPPMTPEPPPHDRAPSPQPRRPPERPTKPDLLPLVWLRDMTPTLDTADIVQGLLIEGSAAVLYGESNAGKSFMMADLALHIATGLPWFERRVEAGGVIYVALEGGARFRHRVIAWRQARGLDDQHIPFAALQSPINLLHPNADTPRLIASIRQAAQTICQPVRLIVIDTLSRALAGGNENASEDMGALVMNMDRIRSDTGAAVLFVHHSGKDQARGARGHSLLRAAIDTEIEVVDHGGPRTATVVKQRDLESGAVFNFTLRQVELGRNRYGEPVTTCLIEPGAVTQQSPAEAKPKSKQPQGPKFTPTERIAINMLRRALSNHGEPLPPLPEYPSNVLAVTIDQWRATFVTGYGGENDETKKRLFRRAKDGLLASATVTSIRNLVWFSHKANEAPNQ